MVPEVRLYFEPSQLGSFVLVIFLENEQAGE